MNITFMFIFGLSGGMVATALFSRIMMAEYPFRCGMTISLASVLMGFVGAGLS